MTETWAQVAEFPEYEVSSHGRFRRASGGQGACAGKLLKWHTCVSTEYPVVRFSRGGKQFARAVHSCVAAAFLGRRPDGMQVRHLDGDTMNCRVDNLAYGTPKENGEDKVRHGTSSAGELNCKAKITWEIAGEIRAAHTAGESSSAIAVRVGLHKTSVCRIIRGTRWAIKC